MIVWSQIKCILTDPGKITSKNNPTVLEFYLNIHDLAIRRAEKFNSTYGDAFFKNIREDDEELTDSVYTRCDNGHTPDDISDCTTHETAESSCCLFTYGQDTGCVLIGFKYLGTKTVGDMVVNCKSENLKIYSFLLIIMSMLLLI